MRIGKVCEKTGLSERTVRYYCEEGLVNPQKFSASGRTYSDYSDEDVLRLKTIASLRRALFTVDELKRMLSDPGEISKVLEGYSTRIDSEMKVRLDVLSQIKEIDFSSVSNIDDLAARFGDVSRRLELPPRDVNPDFSRFDTESRAEKDAAFAEYEERQADLYIWGRRIVIAIAAVNVVLSLIYNVVASFNLIGLVTDIVFSALLVCGVNWVRYLFIASDAFSVISCFTVVIELFKYDGYGAEISFSSQDVFLIVYSVLIFIKSSVCAYLLLAHKGVHEFLYAQRNG